MKVNLLSYNHFRGGAAWIILFSGIILYAIGYFGIDKDSVWKEITIKIADVLVIGVILGYLSNAAQFLGVFKQDLQDIIYGKEFINNRKDIDTLWETLSKQLFKNKFPLIHKEFLKVINNYFPEKEISYYNDYERNTSIEWVNKENGIIKVTDIVSFELVAETAEKFTYPIKTWTKVNNDTIYENKTTEFLVNKKKADIVDLKSATKLFSVLLASKRPLITELADKLRLKYPLLPTISPCPTMRLEAIRSIIPISCRRYPKSV